MGIFSFLGLGNAKIKDALRRHAVVIDVRTAQEFDQGHIPESINIPVDRVAANAERIKAMKRPVVVCCSAGTRGGQAMEILKDKGVKDIYNGGSWQQVLKLLSRI